MRRLLAFTASYSFLGCFSPGLYTTPRTQAPGHFAGAVAAEVAVRPSVSREPNRTETARLVRFPWITGGGRLGVLPHVDAGLAYTPFSGGAASIKVHVTPKWPVDVGLLARFSFYNTIIGKAPYDDSCDRCTPVWRTGFEPILLVGANVHEDVTLVLSPGVYWAFFPDADRDVRGYRITAGAQWRFSDELFVHPEITYMPIAGQWDAGAVVGGIAIGARGSDGYHKRRDDP
jgi:hypothetical protein